MDRPCSSSRSFSAALARFLLERSRSSDEESRKMYMLERIPIAEVSQLLRKFALDHAAFRRNRLNAENVIDSKKLERDLCEKPASTFSHRALERPIYAGPRRK
jgi:hypothetical protein